MSCPFKAVWTFGWLLQSFKSHISPASKLARLLPNTVTCSAQAFQSNPQSWRYHVLCLHWLVQPLVPFLMTCLWEDTYLVFVRSMQLSKTTAQDSAGRRSSMPTYMRMYIIATLRWWRICRRTAWLSTIVWWRICIHRHHKFILSLWLV